MVKYMKQVQPPRTLLNIFSPIKYPARNAQGNLEWQEKNKLQISIQMILHFCQI
jgi:hypothetical protein